MPEVRIPFDLKLPDSVYELSRIFTNAGHSLYVVGGAIRDAVMSVGPKDFDLATDATPEQITNVLLKEVLPAIKIDEVGKSFGVIRALLEENRSLFEYEIATFRRDIGVGRRPDSVEFTTIDEDVKRRDLTINALFYDIANREIVDLVGGLNDIENSIIRTVGDPHARFAEDRLRIMRVFRFAAKLGFSFEPVTASALMSDGDLTGVSPERIRIEFVKIVEGSKDVAKSLRQLEEFGMMPRIFPDLSASTKLDVLVSTRGINSNDVNVVLALLLDENHPDKIVSTFNKLNYTNLEAKSVAFLLRFRDLEAKKAYQLRKAFAATHMSAETLVKYFIERGLPDRTLMSRFLTYLNAEPVKGDDLMAAGFSGKALGLELERRETEIFERLR